MKMAGAYVERLNRAREEQGLSVEALARRSGYPADLVAPLLAGTPVSMSEMMNRELCEALGLDAQEMWRLSQPHAPAERADAVE
jgi:transcriptional regulator with XRE-family HTH domain